MAEDAEKGMTTREMRLLVEVMELEAKNARLVEEKWRDTPDEGYTDGPEALAYERAFASGYATGAKSGADRVSSTLRTTKEGEHGT